MLKMMVEQTLLLQEIVYFKMKLNNKIEDIISQIKNKQMLNEIDMYIRQNHTIMTQEQLEDYLEKQLKMLTRNKLKIVWRNILTKDYSEDTIVTIMALLAKTTTPQETLNQIIKIITQETTEKKIYQQLNKIEI